MSITHTIKIYNLEVKTNYNSKENVIHNIHWGLISKSDDGYESNYVNVQRLNIDELDLENFIEFDDVTKEKCIEWIEATNDLEEVKTNMANNIELQKNPTDKFIHPDWD